MKIMVYLTNDELREIIAERMKAHGVTGKIESIVGTSGAGGHTSVGINGIRIEIADVTLPAKEGPYR